MEFRVNHLKSASPTSVRLEAPSGEEMETIKLENAAGLSSQNHQDDDKTTESNKHDEEPWICPASTKSIRTVNPIRAIVDPIAKNIQSGTERGDGKDPISLALGDPTVGGNLPPCSVAISTIQKTLSTSPHAAGYINACGTTEARRAIAQYHSDIPNNVLVRPENVIVANGCSGALELALTALMDPGTALLVPQPGFPLYQVIAESHGASVFHYRLNPDRRWECDLDHLRELMATHNNIRGIVVNNPSNPTGAVFSERHLQELVHFAATHHLPIVADEVYGKIVFGTNQFHPLAEVAARLGSRVPVITASGLAKQFLLPGWRVGWIVFHDNIHGSLQQVEAGAQRLAQVILGASHLVQTAVPALLSATDIELNEWKQNLRSKLEHQASYLCNALSACPGLRVIWPQGAMYAMVSIDIAQLDIANDLEFSSKLLREENVFVLPGSAFGVPNAFRVVLCSDISHLRDAALRIQQFCQLHSIQQ